MWNVIIVLQQTSIKVFLVCDKHNLQYKTFITTNNINIHRINFTSKLLILLWWQNIWWESRRSKNTQTHTIEIMTSKIGKQIDCCYLPICHFLCVIDLIEYRRQIRNWLEWKVRLDYSETVTKWRENEIVSP